MATSVSTTEESKSQVLAANIKDKTELYKAYMPFVKNGGLFVATDKSFQLGDEIIILLNLMGETERFTITGKIVWVTPKCAQGGRATGIGVQFTSEDSKNARNKIETYLAGTTNSDRRTDTM